MFWFSLWFGWVHSCFDGLSGVSKLFSDQRGSGNILSIDNCFCDCYFCLLLFLIMGKYNRRSHLRSVPFNSLITLIFFRVSQRLVHLQSFQILYLFRLFSRNIFLSVMLWFGGLCESLNIFLVYVCGFRCLFWICYTCYVYLYVILFHCLWYYSLCDDYLCFTEVCSF